MSKGVRIGLKDIYYAVLSKDDQDTGQVTYSTPKRFAPAISATVTPTENSETLYADDGPYEVASAKGEITIELNVTDISTAVYAEITGATVATDGSVEEAQDDVAPYVALGWRSQTSTGKYKYFWYYKGRFASPEEEFQTKEDSPSFQTPTISATFITRQADGMRRKFINENDEGVDADVIKNWFKAVPVPPAPPAP
ncbi:major tail protein [Paenibacillus apiarius]|uniref:major tail protein n=1 Tax=Paenibacillus apiarius TaxID=46240 RepID=UPI003B3AB6A7